nr:Chain C, Moesin/ezrin/radixin homolog 2 [Drosophila melanogaster]7EDR_D Chain D, Moesin/ezrin/radixin homolog 2 [Drosophila melanogaster]
STNDLETAGGAELTTHSSHYLVQGDNSSGISDDFEPKEFILTDNEMEQITNEMERNHLDYLRNSKQVQSQLQTLRSEIAPHKIEENQSNLDILSEAQIKAGENKYSTLKKLKSGSTKARVAFFEEL